MITSAPSIPTSSPFSRLDPACESMVAITAVHRLLQLQRHMWLTAHERRAFESADRSLREARATINEHRASAAHLQELLRAVDAELGSIAEAIGDGFCGMLAAAALDALDGISRISQRSALVLDNLWCCYAIHIQNMDFCLADSTTEYRHLVDSHESRESQLLKEIEGAIVLHRAAGPSVIGDRFAISFEADFRRAMSLLSERHRGQRRTQA